MVQECKICNNAFDVEEFSSCEVRAIMEEEHICFKCAFWKMQKRRDGIRPDMGIIPIILQKQILGGNEQSHYCLTIGPNNVISREKYLNDKVGIKDLFKNVTTGILTTDGWLFPYNGYSQSGGLSHQGTIPVNNHDFTTNAKFIYGGELSELINSPSVHLENLEIFGKRFSGFAVKVEGYR